MGGFLITKTPAAEGKSAVDPGPALAAFAAKEIPRTETIRADGFQLYLFDKKFVSSENYLGLPNGDFIFATGTLLYRGLLGSRALDTLYREFLAGGDVFTRLSGHFCVGIFAGGKLDLFNDYNGFYPVYCDRDRNVFGSSFLAVCKSLPRLTIAPQESVEYLLYGATYGDKTPFAEVELLDSTHVHRVIGSGSKKVKRFKCESFVQKLSLEFYTEQLSDALLAHTKSLQPHFDNRICTALTGGFDSRLLLACLLKSGITPHLYVYGRESDKDVRIARNICEGEKLPLTTFDKSTHPEPDDKTFVHNVFRSYHFHDALGEIGVFDSGADLATRDARAGENLLQMNGGGGEYLRNFWKIHAEEVPVARFVDLALNPRLDGLLDPLTPEFEERTFFRALQDKVRYTLGTESETLTSRECERLYLDLRMRYWAARTFSSNNLLAFAIAPLSQPQITEPASHVPLEHKSLGAIEAAMIAHISPVLAAYPWDHGASFNGYPSLRAKLAYTAKSRLRYYAKPVFSHPRLAEPLRRVKNRETEPEPLPFYLTKKYRNLLLGDREFYVRRFIDIDRIVDRDQLNRALTLELLFRDLGLA